MTPLKIALFHAGSADATHLVGRLERSLTDAGIDAGLMAFGSVPPDLDISGFDAFFLSGLPSSDPADLALHAADDAMRAALSKAEIAYQVIYGSDEASVKQITQLMHAIENRVKFRPIQAALSDQKKSPHPDGAAPWVWLCDKCSDPQCEHRLLTDLIQQRQTRFLV